MADLQDTYAKILALQSGGGNTPSALTGMGPSTAGMDPSRFSFGDAYSFGLMNNMFNQGPMASEAVPPSAPPSSSSPTGNTLGDIGLALGLFGSGLRGDMLPGIAVMQQLEQRKQQAAVAKQKQEEREIALRRQDMSDTFSLWDRIKDSKAGLDVLKKKAQAGSQTAQVLLMAGVGQEDYASIPHLLPKLQALDPEAYGRIQQAIESGTVNQLDPMWLRGLKDRTIEETKRSDTATAEARDFAKLQAMPPEALDPRTPNGFANFQRFQELNTKREKMLLDYEKYQATRSAAGTAPQAGPPGQPVGQPSAGVQPVSKGERDLALGVDSPEARTIKREQEQAQDRAKELLRAGDEQLQAQALQYSNDKYGEPKFYAEMNAQDQKAVLERWEATKGNIAARQGSAAEMAKTIEAGAQEKIGVLRNNILVLKNLTQTWDKLTPEQKARYVGVINFPLERLTQFINQQSGKGGDKVFAEFASKVHMAKNLAFQAGGKQLTPFEASVVFGYTPTGEEMSVADFEAKMKQAGENTRNILRLTTEMATMPRGELRQKILKEQSLQSGGPAPKPKDIQQKFKKLGELLQ